MKNMISKAFPSFGQKQITLYYILTIFSNGWFVLANWVFYFSKFLTIEQIGLIDGIAIIVGVFAEVPTGAIGDLLGKRNTLFLGSLMRLLGLLVILFSDSFLLILAGNCFAFIGDAFNSGTDKALIYDTLVDSHLESKYDKILSSTSTIALLTTVFVTATGGMLFGLNAKFPWIAWAVFELGALFILSKMSEPRVDTYKFTLKNYIKQNVEGFLHVFNKNMRGVFVLIVPMLLLENIVSGIIRQNLGAHLGYDGDTFGYLLSFSFLITAGFAMKFGGFLEKFKESGLVLSTMLIFLVGFVLVSTGLANGVVLGGAVIVMFSVGQIFSGMATSVIANKHIDSKYRSTALSALSLMNRLPYLVIAVFFAAVAKVENIESLFGLFSVVLGVLFVMVVLVSALQRNTRLKYSEILAV